MQAAARQAAALRRAAAKDTLERLFAILELRPRVEPALLGNVVVAFVDGLAIDWGLAADDAATDRGGAAARVAFDVFWLAMLSLAE